MQVFFILRLLWSDVRPGGGREQGQWYHDQVPTGSVGSIIKEHVKKNLTKARQNKIIDLSE